MAKITAEWFQSIDRKGPEDGKLSKVYTLHLTNILGFLRYMD